MRITFYDTRLAENDMTMLVKEKSVNYAESVSCPKEAAAMMRKLLHLDDMAEEYCYMIAQNSSCKVLGVFLISKGTVNASLISPREIFIRALLIGAVHIIICHNHPSHNTIPSREDITTTRRIREAGELMNIALKDHIIIGGDSYFSFSEEKML